MPGGAIGVSHNLVIVNNAGGGFVTAYPADPMPFASTANASGRTSCGQPRRSPRWRPGGTVRYYAMMPTDLVVDVTGWFEG